MQGISAVYTAVASPVTSDGLGIQRHTTPAKHRIPHTLDVFNMKKDSERHPEAAPLSPHPDAWDSAEGEYLCHWNHIHARNARNEGDRSSVRERIPKEIPSGQQQSGHVCSYSQGQWSENVMAFYKLTACFANQTASSSSLSVPSAR